MAKLIGVIAAVIVSLSVMLGFSALIAWLLSLAITFVTGYEIGFLKTWVALFIIHNLSNAVFSGARRKEAK